ncbi:hypothetical protein GCM10022381_39390 [Leifsonia kafniensis]|uniref:FHA domain-containing protein n=2 Tax=Leifsonia kafniensis TaxID=475957 RepID=A0ABP7L2H6_9MICO
MGDTSIIQPLPPQSAVFSIPYRMPDDALAATPVVAPARQAPHVSLPERSVESEPTRAEPVAVVPVTVERVAAEPAGVEPVAVAPAEPEPVACAAVASEPAETAPAAHFVLQFSTGEHVVVAGTGLLGRRPNAQPDETFDHFVQIHDVSMSVSKSHLEFGQHNGEFWINDRMSGNGTVIRRQDDSVLRCEPGRRYLVARGSRVEIGDQFFILG